MADKILIIEDEKILSKAIGIIFKKQGFDVETASTAEEGFNLAKKNNFNLALVDYILPGMDGLEACNRLNKESPETRLILMSGYIEDVDQTKESLKKINAKGYFIEKPFNAETIIKMTKDILTG